MQSKVEQIRYMRDDEGFWLRLRIPAQSVAPVMNWLAKVSVNKAYELDLKEHRERRSLDANRYAWELMGQMADKLRTGKDEVYIEMLKRYGQGGLVKIRKSDCENILREFRYYEEHEKLNEENAAYYRVWVGSSQYNTFEMSVFIDGIVSECKELGIETMTPEELARMKEDWH